jgi:LacI family transcriptional regulator
MVHGQAIRRVTLLLNLSEDPAYEFTRGILEYRDQAPHWQLVGSRNRAFSLLKDIDPDQVDGVIGYLTIAERVDELTAKGVAVATVAGQIQAANVACAGIDPQAIGQVGAEYLLERGFARFGYIHVPQAPDSQQTLAAFSEVIEAADKPCHVFDVKLRRSNVPRPEFHRWLVDLPKPIAILASDDRYGRWAIDDAAELGLRVPDEVAVLGIRNDRWATIVAATPMSSIDPNQRRAGYRAAMMLDAMMAGEPLGPMRLIPPRGVITRRSTEITVTEDELVSAALAYIRDHCLQGLTVEQVSEHLDCSPRTLQLRMKHAIGQTPKTAITRAVVRRAQQMLTETKATMEQIAFACGFQRQAHFNVLFKKQTGVTPGEYRRELKIPDLH